MRGGPGQGKDEIAQKGAEQGRNRTADPPKMITAPGAATNTLQLIYPIYSGTGF